MEDVKLPHLAPDRYRTEFMEILRETNKAYHIQFDDAETHWVPKSACKIHKGTNIIDLAIWKFKEITK